MSEPLILASTLGAAALGALLASGGDPAACHWSSFSARTLKQRLALLKWTSPGRARRLIAGVALSGFLASGGLLAYAAEPSAPEQLPREVVGVVGSGDQLSLQVKAANDEATRSLKVGKEYKDGWILTGLTPTAATLTKADRSTIVGLNPTGAVSSDALDGPPSQVQVTGGNTCNIQANSTPLDQTTVDRLYTARTSRTVNALGTPASTPDVPGLSPDENKRYIAYSELRTTAANPCAITAVSFPAMRQVLNGPAYDDWRALEIKRIDNRPSAPASVSAPSQCIAMCSGLFANDVAEIHLLNGTVIGVGQGQDPVEVARESGLVTSLDGVPLAPLYPPTWAEIEATAR